MEGWLSEKDSGCGVGHSKSRLRGSQHMLDGTAPPLLVRVGWFFQAGGDGTEAIIPRLGAAAMTIQLAQEQDRSGHDDFALTRPSHCVERVGDRRPGYRCCA